MNKFLENRLKECNIKSEDILAKIDRSKYCNIYIYTSHMDGLGTNESDFDIYVIYDNTSDVNKDMIERNNEIFKKRCFIDSVELDIEYIGINTIYNLIDKLNKLCISIEELKVLNRLKNSEILYKSSEINNCIYQISTNKMQKVLYNTYLDQCRDCFEDCLILYKYEDYISALVLAKQALTYSIALVNTINNRLNCKLKWAPKILINTMGYESDITKKYLKLQVYNSVSENNIKYHIEETLEFIQNIISNASIQNI